MSPYLPSIPTDSLHKFVAITGLVLAIVPPAYLESLSSENKVDSIHLQAEVALLDLKQEGLRQEHEVLYGTYRQIVRRAKTVKAPAAPRTAAQRLVFKEEVERMNRIMKLNAAASDSAGAATKKLNDVSYQLRAAAIRVDEKQAVLDYKKKIVGAYQGAYWGFIAFGLTLSLIGFAWWYGKEGAPDLVKKPQRTPLPKPALKPSAGAESSLK